MPDLPKNVLYYGRPEPLPERIALRAGPLSMVLEEGALRYVRLGDREVIRGVYAAVRDQNWDTVPFTLSDVRVEARPDSFDVSFTADHREGDVEFAWAGTITGDPSGTVRFVFDGEARSTFRRNRIGLCVLHPARECPGARCRIGHADGTVEEAQFPRLISPHQPFSDIRSIAHEVSPGLWAEVAFEGDAFEMEDQRNWTDASFKTYCTPLRLPFPVTVEAGTHVRQSVTLTLHGEPRARGTERPDEGVISVTALGNKSTALPAVGLAVASHGRPLTPAQVQRLRVLRPAHLRVDLLLHQDGWYDALARASRESTALGAPLEAALFLSPAAEREIADLAGALRDLRPRVRTWLVFHRDEKSTAEKWAVLARQALGPHDPAARFGAGSKAYFTELNRVRPPTGVLDVVAYSVNPQVHAFDNSTLAEALEVQGTTVTSARAFCGGRAIAVSPVTLKPRFNPDATGPDPDPPPGTLPKEVDVRQMSLFGAGWTLGSLKYLAEGGADSVTFYETTGWRGVMEEEDGSPAPELFPSLSGSVFPLYHVLADVAEFGGGEVMHTKSDDTLAVEAMLVRRGNRTRMLLVNLSPRPRRVSLGMAGRAVVRKLDETNAVEAMTRPEEFRRRPGEPVLAGASGLTVELLPYAIARIDHGD